MNLTSFLQSNLKVALSVFPSKVLTLNDGTELNVIYNNSRHSRDKEMGGWQYGNGCLVMVSKADFCEFDPDTLLETKVTLDGKSWRIESITDGDIAITLELVAVFKS